MTRDELTHLYEQYGYLVFRRCRGILRDDAEAQDAVQEVFLRALRYPRSLSRAHSQLGWFYRTSERCCFDRLKRSRREVAIAPEIVEQAVSEGLSQSSVEARELVMAFLGRFDVKVQRVAVLHYLDGLPQEEIARQLGWSRRTVGKKLALLRSRASALSSTLSASPGGD